MIPTRKKPTLAGILKWIGIITAVISLILGAREVMNIVLKNIADKKKAAELRIEARQLAISGLYSKAWESVSQAVELDADSREAQVGIAMEWLRNVHIPPGQKERTFTEIVEKLAPVLHLAVDTTRNEYAATVQAHIGYGMYLLFKEGNWGVNVENNFRTALQLDSTNVFANTMYGFWILYPGHGDQSIDDANRYFDAALRSGKERAYVRHMMHSAFGNASGPAYEAQIIRMANDMRTNHEELEREERLRILSRLYYPFPNENMEEIGKLLSAEDQLETFLYLTNGIKVEEKGYLKANLAALKTAARR